jgi:hypothetical protein|tara:strand:- start:1396 stop:1638 length:243 start_codon:yes stop_codon:yes gene_type:complete
MARDPLDRDYQGPGVFSHTVTEKNDFGGPGRAGACGVNMGDGIVCLRQVELEDFRHGDQAARIFLSPSHWHSYGVIGGPR